MIKGRRLVRKAPFDMKWSEYAKMFDERPPERLEIVINVVRIDKPNTQFNSIDFLTRLENGIKKVLSVQGNSLNSPSVLKNLGIKELNWVVDQENIITMQSSQLTGRRMDEWAIDGDYIQLGFRPIGSSASPDVMVRGMMEYDNLIDFDEEMNFTLRPEQQNPSRIAPSKIGDASPFAISAASGRQAVWCEELIDLRNRWMVTLWELGLGAIPYLAYAQYVELGCEYYVDYPDMSQR